MVVGAAKGGRVMVVFVVFVVLTAMADSAAVAGAAEFEKYAVESVSSGLSTTQAGAHADFTTVFKLTNNNGAPYGTTRDIRVTLPPGVVGNTQGVPRCTTLQLGGGAEESHCPLDSQVGTSEITIGGSQSGTLTEPVYNMVSPGGDVVARFGFFAASYPTLLNVRVNPVDYGLVASVEGAAAGAALIEAATTFWGIPADPGHDNERITPAEALKGGGPPGGRKSGLPEAPFLSNPTACGFQRQLTVTAASYQLPDSPSSLTGAFPDIVGCGKLSFDPSLTVNVTSGEAAAPTGLDSDLQIPQDETPHGLATSTLKSASVLLPAGLAINPAAGEGLEACSPAQVGYEHNEPSHCPDGAKIGTLEVVVPALEHALRGSVYQRTPEPGHLFRIWLVTDEQGVHLKLPGEIEADLQTGRLRAVFAGIPALGGLPQVPVADLKLDVFGGPRAPLATPATCGTYQTHYELAPWSGGPTVTADTPMQVSSGCAKGGFSPRLTAGTVNSGAGAFSPFALTVTRSDGEANPSGLEVLLPPGLTGKLAGIPLCPEPQASTGECPDASQVGTVTAAVGVGGTPLWLPQPGKTPTAIYLAGAYKDAPFSLVVKVPAQAGPFDLGTVITRAGIYIDPNTAQVTVKSDPLPQILQGVPVDYRTIHVDIGRPGFTLNPTNCDAMAVKATLTAAGGATASPGSGFQATNCAKLAFKPSFKASTSGKTSRKTGASLSVKLLYPNTPLGTQANILSVKVNLPKQLPSRLTTLQQACTDAQFTSNPAGCPAVSRVGQATAITPILPVPITGPAYFVSHGGAKFPELIIVLQGDGITIDLHGETFISKAGITSSTFHTVPDQPVTSFELTLPQGPNSALAANGNLCTSTLKMPTLFTGQNGAVIKQSTPITVTGCSKKKPRKAKKARKATRHHKAHAHKRG
jgi:hypothetical protein